MTHPADYVLRVDYGEDDSPIRIPLNGVTPDEAETRRQALLHDIEHAIEVGAPVIYSEATVADPEAGVPIDPSRVTGVDLVDPD